MNDNSRMSRELHRLVDEVLEHDGRRCLVAVRVFGEHLVWLEQRAVMRARLDGLSWAKVGRLLGRSAQAVRQRHWVAPQRLMPPLSVPRDEAILAAWERVKQQRRWEDEEPVAW